MEINKFIGLAPIAAIDYAVLPTDPAACVQAKITVLQGRIERKTERIAAKQARLALRQARITQLEGYIAANQESLANINASITAKQDRITAKQARIDTLTAQLAGLDPASQAAIDKQALIDTLSADITRLTAEIAQKETLRTDKLALIAEREAKILTLAAIIETLTTDIARLTDEIAAHVARITVLEDRLAAGTYGNCSAGDDADMNALYYLHADHLGRPQFATDDMGDIIWDMGGEVTPFGDGVNLAGALAQALMFPGQYADAETSGAGTALSHNWHRTYDPTLGRYLQSDPIGLAGGLNRYAYVGGNPVSLVDPIGFSLSVMVMTLLTL